MKYLLSCVLVLAFCNSGAQDVLLVRTLDSLKQAHNAMIDVQKDSIFISNKSIKAFKGSAREAQMNQDIKDRMAAILKIYDSHGFPGHDEAGKEGSTTFTKFVIYLFDLEFKERILGLLKTELERGNASPEDYAKLFDSVYGAKHKKSYYGSFLVTTKDGRAKCCSRPLEDPKGVNERRAAIGLGTLEQAILDKEKAIRENPDVKNY